MGSILADHPSLPPSRGLTRDTRGLAHLPPAGCFQPFFHSLEFFFAPRSREPWPLAPTWRIAYPQPERGGSWGVARMAAWRDLASMSVDSGEGGGEIRPAGHRNHGAGACGHRAGVSQWGIAGVALYEQRGAPPRDVPARSHAKTGRRAGLDAQPERPLHARGAKQNPHAVKSKTRAAHPPNKKHP